MREIWFDMDGTFVDFYGVENWLNDIHNENVRPYKIANPLINMANFARVLNRLQRNGYKIGIISWLARGVSDEYNEEVRNAKIEWLAHHLPSVRWDEIRIVEYGNYKEVVCDYSDGILFDDEVLNRYYWNGDAYDVNNIIEVLRRL